MRRDPEWLAEVVKRIRLKSDEEAAEFLDRLLARIDDSFLAICDTVAR